MYVLLCTVLFCRPIHTTVHYSTRLWFRPNLKRLVFGRHSSQVAHRHRDMYVLLCTPLFCRPIHPTVHYSTRLWFPPNLKRLVFGRHSSQVAHRHQDMYVPLCTLLFSRPIHTTVHHSTPTLHNTRLWFPPNLKRLVFGRHSSQVAHRHRDMYVLLCTLLLCRPIHHNSITSICSCSSLP